MGTHDESRIPLQSLTAIEATTKHRRSIGLCGRTEISPQNTPWYSRPSKQGSARRFRLVERARLAVEVRFVLEGVEHLNFILRTEEDSTISAILTTSFDLFGSGPFDVSLAIVEYGLRTDITRTR